MTGGSAGSGGYEYQSRVIAYVSAFMLSQKSLGWLELGIPDIPSSVSAETGGPGDDFALTFSGSAATAEVQVKRGLRNDYRFEEMFLKFCDGLKRDSPERLILVVDRTSSVVIREDLREDLERIRNGRVDGLRPITTEAVQSLLAQGSPDGYAALKRVSVVVLDLEEPSSGHSLAATSNLGSILEKPEEARKVWDVLCLDSLHMCSQRGRRDAVNLVEMLGSKGVQLKKTSGPGLLSAYCSWLGATTRFYTVPGLAVPVPIDTAWAQVHAVDARREDLDTFEVEEWTHLLTPAIHRAQDLTEFGRRLVVVGAPGSGKSTLCRRVAHRLSTDGRCVLWVKLARVTDRLLAGETIDEALTIVGTDGFGNQGSQLRELVDRPDCLLADGLDECGDQRLAVIEDLRRWATARPGTRIVVTSRPTGYAPGYFEGWDHARLLPLLPEAVGRYAETLISIVEPDLARQKVDTFKQQLRDNRVAAAAARNPLLLALLIQASLAGACLSTRRSVLYEQVLDLWRTSPHRSVDDAPDVDYLWRAAEIAAWTMMKAVGSRDGQEERVLLERIADHFCTEGGLPILAARRTARSCLDAWEHLGVLDRYAVAGQHFWLFSHLTFSEYFAGRYVVALPSHERAVWFDSAVDQPWWKETLLFAAGAGAGREFVMRLLDIARDDPADGRYAVRVVEALSEMDVQADLITQATGPMRDLLTATVPSVAFEAAQAASRLALQAPELTMSIIDPMLRHTQVWTRLAALLIALDCGDKLVPLDDFEACLFDREQDAYNQFGVVGHISPIHLFWCDVLDKGAEVLARLRPTERTLDLLVSRAKHPAMFGNAYSAIDRALHLLGHPGADSVNPTIEAGEEFLKNADLGWGSGLASLLTTILDVFGASTGGEVEPRNLRALGRLLRAGNCPRDSRGWDYRAPLSHSPEVAYALRTMACALGLKDGDLVADARWCLDLVDQNGEEVARELIPEVPGDYEIGFLSFDEVELNLLLGGLTHGPLIAQIVISLLAAQNDADRVERLERRLSYLPSGGVVWLMKLGEGYWGETYLLRFTELFLDEAFELVPEVFLELDGLIPPGESPEILRLLRRGMLDRNVDVARAACASLVRLMSHGLEVPLADLRAVLDEWLVRPLICPNCGQDHRVQRERCRRGVDIPVSELIIPLARSGTVTIDEILAWCGSDDFGLLKAAIAGCVSVVEREPHTLSDVLRAISDERCSVRTLGAVFQLDESLLKGHKGEILSLAASRIPLVRYYLIGMLEDASWVPQEEVQALCICALHDEHPVIRIQAVDTLRVRNIAFGRSLFPSR